MILKGNYVEIVQEVLSVEERTANIPEDTKNTPLKLWAKGWLLNDSEEGDTVLIRTINGRILEGTVTEIKPSYKHDFGEFIPEVMFIGTQAKSVLWGDDFEKI